MAFTLVYFIIVFAALSYLSSPPVERNASEDGHEWSELPAGKLSVNSEDGSLK